MIYQRRPHQLIQEEQLYATYAKPNRLHKKGWPKFLESTMSSYIQAMAHGLKVFYSASSYDPLGVLYNRLSGDDIELDDVELMLLELERRGHISPELAVQLHSSYLDTL